ncbi:MAG: DNA translocase FtsK 4TM domain-containing protein [Brevinematales bacterium]|nr:DNA translocase FtsK 4TM domain-containing protein [Brevinematales bacterium]
MRLVIGYLCLGISAFLLLAVISFHPTDTALFVSQPNPIVENIAGKGGAWVSAYLVVIYGFPSALLLSFGFLVVGLHILAKSKLGHIWLKVLFFFMAAISLSVVSAVLSKEVDYRWGGLVGFAIVTTLSEILPRPIIGGIFLLSFLWSLVASIKALQKLIFLFIQGLVSLVQTSRHHEELSEALSPLPLEETHEELSFAPEREEVREEPEFLRRPLHKEEDANIEVPFWLVDSSAFQALREEVAQACDVTIPSSPPASSSDLTLDTHPLPEESPAHKPAEENLSESLFEAHTEEIPPLSPQDKEESTPFSFSSPPSLEKNPSPPTHEILSLRDDQPQEEHKRSSHFSYKPPATSLLEVDLKERFGPEDEKEVKAISHLIEMTFKSFKIDVKVVGYSRGPAITRYEVQPPLGLKLRSITNLIDDLALNLGDAHIRIVTPIGERGLIGIEVPNRKRRHVLLREVVESEEFQKSEATLPLILGKDITGNILVDDLTEMPHLLIAGTTGSGKSVYVNALLASLLFKKSYEEIRFLLIDPKMVELELYNGLPHLLAPVITQPEVAIVVLEWVVREMERRYKLFSERGVRNIAEYFKISPPEKDNFLFYLVVVIDEFADLMLRIPKETERVISRLAAMARAVGIHLVVATQRPSVDVVTGIIKANFPSRIAFRVSSQTDSRTILDRGGAEKLLGKGDMLFLSPKNTDLLRLQAPYVSGKEIETLVYEIKRQKKPEYLLDIDALMEEVENPPLTDGEHESWDPLFEEALRLAAETGEVSASFLQRKLRIGYNRASRIMDMMESLRILGPSTGTSKPRQVLISPEEVDHYLETE